MFVNYFKDIYRDNPLNLFIARTTLAIFCIWKLLSYNYTGLKDWPDFIFQDHYHSHFLIHPVVLDYIWIEVVIIFILLLLFFFGYKTRYTAFFSALFITHITALHYAITNSGCTWLPVVYFLMIFAIYSETDKISFDNFFSLRKLGINTINESLRKNNNKYSHIILTHILIITALIYFFTGLSKLTLVGFEWASSGYMNKLLLREYLFHLNDLPFFSTLIIESKVLGWISGVLTIFLEIGFLVAVLLKRNITLFIFGLAGMHVMIYLTMEIFFFDQFILYLFFVPWDKVARKVKVIATPIEVVYDNSCLLCASSLHMFKYLDVKNELSFFSSQERPMTFQEVSDASFSSEMFLSIDKKVFSGFFAFRELFAKWWFFFIFYKLLYIGIVEKYGVKIYKAVAANRSEIYGCKV
jgi:predicted DCC family thiol-disulfide oxidoreductase YuxK